MDDLGKSYAIIVDYDMPEIDGIEFLKILRSEGDTTPIIIFTGVGHEHTAIEAINNGANFFLRKGEDPQMQFRELVTMVKTAVERTYRGKNLGTSKRIISDMLNFSSDPGFAIDREGKVAAWNASLEQLTDTPAKDMIDKNDYVYAEPFFGTRRKMHKGRSMHSQWVRRGFSNLALIRPLYRPLPHGELRHGDVCAVQPGVP